MNTQARKRTRAWVISTLEPSSQGTTPPRLQSPPWRKAVGNWRILGLCRIWDVRKGANYRAPTHRGRGHCCFGSGKIEELKEHFFGRGG